MAIHVYLAGRYERRRELCAYRDELKSRGYCPVSTWLDGPNRLLGDGTLMGTQREALVESFAEHHSDDITSLRGELAFQDLADVMRADVLVLFTEPPGGTVGARGGRHVEFGFAMGLAAPRVDGKPKVVLVGPRENLFHWLPGIEHYPDWPACLNGRFPYIKEASHEASTAISAGF